MLTVKLLAGSMCENKAEAVLDCVDDSLDADDTDNRLRRWYCWRDGLCARRINDGVDGDGRKEDLPKKCMPIVLVLRCGDCDFMSCNGGVGGAKEEKSVVL